MRRATHAAAAGAAPHEGSGVDGAIRGASEAGRRRGPVGKTLRRCAVEIAFGIHRQHRLGAGAIGSGERVQNSERLRWSRWNLQRDQHHREKQRQRSKLGQIPLRY